MELNIKNFTSENVSITIKENTIFISGTIDDLAPGIYLMPFLKSVNDALIKNKIKEIHVDVRDLQFINSSGIKELVYWIMKATKLKDEHKYRIIFICNPEIEWQTDSIAKVTLLAPHLVEIRSESF
jgi:hypothetical protein